jgi:hypothetical protein
MAPDTRFAINLNTMDAEKLMAEVKLSRDPDDPSADRRHEIIVDRADLSSTVAQVRLHLGEITNLYVRAGSFVLLTHEADSKHHQPKLLAVPAKEASLHEALTRHMRFIGVKPDGNKYPTQVPKEVLQAILQGDKSGVRPLKHVVDVPVVQFDGSLTQQGYDESSKKYVYLRDLIIDVGEDITQAQAAQAATKLLNLIKQTPLASRLDKAVWLANLLTRLAIDAYDGPSPLFYYMASTAGVGKTLLARLAGVVATGNTTKEFRFPDNNEEEMGKILDTVHIEGIEMFFFDNLRNGHTIESPGLDEFITSDNRCCRILGQSKSFISYLKPVTAITANNAQLGADLARRVLVANLDGSLIAGLTKDGYEIADIYQHTKERWDEYLSSALTILVGFLRLDKQERTKYAIKPYGSFEQWGAVVGGSIKWALGEDVSLAVGRGSKIDSSNQRDVALVELLLPYADGEYISLSRVFEGIDDNYDLKDQAIEALGTANPGDASKRLGHALAMVSGKEIPYTYADGRTAVYKIVRRRRGKTGPSKWSIELVGGTGDDTDVGDDDIEPESTGSVGPELARRELAAARAKATREAREALKAARAGILADLK